MAAVFYDGSFYLPSRKSDREAKNSIKGFSSFRREKIPSASVFKQLAIAIQSGKNFKSVTEFLVSTRDSFPNRETRLSLAAVKSLVLEKSEKVSLGIGVDRKTASLIHSLFSDENFLGRKSGSALEPTATAKTLLKAVHGAPPNSFVVKLSEIVGSFKSLRKMALFWCKVVAELRQLWIDGKHIPGVPLDDSPDLNSCLIYQKLQVINCCISRKRRRSVAAESLDSVVRGASLSPQELGDPKDEIPAAPRLYARLCSGEFVLRLGTKSPTRNLTMLETGEPVYSPVNQEGPLLTEDFINETQEFVLKTGSDGAACSQLLSDMQAFKAANPGCILEDFIRWYSPADWIKSESGDEVKDTSNGASMRTTKGQLSSRMQKKGNLWRQLWKTAKPVPAVKQIPLFDEDVAVEDILNALEHIPVSELFEQLFASLLGLGVSIAESTLSADSNFSKLFCECKDYVVTTCQSNTWNEKIDDLCEVYETIEAMLFNPRKVLKLIKQAEDASSATGEAQHGFRKLGLKFGFKDRRSRNSPSKEHKEEKNSASRPEELFPAKYA